MLFHIPPPVRSKSQKTNVMGSAPRPIPSSISLELGPALPSYSLQPKKSPFKCIFQEIYNRVLKISLEILTIGAI